jgi:hypothetical protein
MSIAKLTRDFVGKIETGKVFTYADIPSDKISTIAIEFSRLYKQGIIKKFSKGKYYKPQKTRFGEMGPSSKEKINSYMDAEKFNYETGLNSFRLLGLTTQVANLTTIATNQSARRVKVDNLNIKFVRTRVNAPKKYIKLLQILDALKDIKSIPDTTASEALLYLKDFISKLTQMEQKKLAIFVKEYTPRTKALLGAILKDLGLWEEAYKIKSGLNSLTKYKLGIKDNILKNKKEWSIV